MFQQVTTCRNSSDKLAFLVVSIDHLQVVVPHPYMSWTFYFTNQVYPGPFAMVDLRRSRSFAPTARGLNWQPLQRLIPCFGSFMLIWSNSKCKICQWGINITSNGCNGTGTIIHATFIRSWFWADGLLYTQFRKMRCNSEHVAFHCSGWNLCSNLNECVNKNQKHGGSWRWPIAKWSWFYQLLALNLLPDLTL